jgi:hypothetical protein
MLEGYTTEEQRSLVRSLWTKWLNAKNINKEIFPVYGGKGLLRKNVQNWVEKFLKDVLKSRGRPVKIATEATTAGWRVDSNKAEDNDRQFTHCTRMLPWFSLQYKAWSFEFSESVRTVVAQRIIQVGSDAHMIRPR